MIILNKSGKFKIKNKIDNIDDVELILLETSTETKGNTFTIIKPKYLYYNTHVNLKAKFVYSDRFIYEISDVYYDDFCDMEYSSWNCLSFNLNATSISSIFNIYPFIIQLNRINDYIIYENLNEYGLYPCKFELKTDKNKYIWSSNPDEYSDDDWSLDCFKKAKIRTSVRNIMNESSFIIFHKNKWGLTKDIPEKFNAIGIYFDPCEDIYLLSYIQFSYLNSIKIEVEVKLKKELMSDYDESFCLFSNNICDTLTHIYYLTQIINIELNLLKKYIRINFNITINNKQIDYSLDISPLQNKSLCLFKKVMEIGEYNFKKEDFI